MTVAADCRNPHWNPRGVTYIYLRGKGETRLNERDNEWGRKLAEEHIADLLDTAKNGKTQTIVDFDGNFEVRFIAPHLETVVSELSPPAESGESDLETLDSLQMPAPPVVRPDEKKG